VEIEMEVSTSSTQTSETQDRRASQDALRSAAVVVFGAAMMVAMAFGAMMMLTSPDGWVMKAANQAVSTAQQGTLASYDVAFGR
jgi:hypothetical protein